MQMNVGQQSKVEPSPKGEKPTGKIQGNAIQVHAQQQVQLDTLVAHEGEGCEEVLTELPVCYPRFTLAISLKRERIDENRLAPPKLNVIGTTVFERHAALQSPLLECQRDESCTLELAEGPFVGVGDKGDLFGLNYFVGTLRFGTLNLHILMRN
jgi:hypothetical protein